MLYHGNAVCEGYAVGPIYSYKPFEFHPTEARIADREIPEALEKLREIRQKADEELQSVYEQMMERDPSKAEVFQAHREILEDEAMVEDMENAISDENSDVAWAIASVFDGYSAMIGQSGDALIQERVADMQDVKNRMLRISQGAENKSLSSLPYPSIIVTHDLLPSDTATIDRANVLAIVTEIGGPTSHAAIIARSYGIPTILGMENAVTALRDGETVIVDAVKGEVLTEQDDSVIAEFQKREEHFKEQKRLEAQWLDKPCCTSDGEPVAIGMNIGALNNTEKELIPACDLCGLFRTEFLYMDSDHMPTEEEQFQAYRKTLEAFRGKPVTLRTLDIGGDKTLPYFQLPKEDNPFLGNRALRLCLSNRPLFIRQLRAALRAACYGDLWIMFPMVGSIEDIYQAKEALEEARESLKRDNIPFGECKVGIMVEIPSIALLAEEAAQLVDFASIGTNDLSQYLSASDRQNPSVAPYYQASLPAALRAIRIIVDGFQGNGKPISVCGEMGGDPLVAPILVGMGIRKLSMSASRLARIKKEIGTRTLEELKELAQKALSEPTAAGIRHLYD